MNNILKKGYCLNLRNGGRMSLEHRWSARKRVCLEALVFHRFTGLSQVKILDISLEGVFISAEHLKLPLPSVVELTFSLNIGRIESIYQLQAMVIHHSDHGYGLMFKDFRLEAYQALKGILYAA
jgi:hypothetical protein